jgi:hypothetical protein
MASDEAIDVHVIARLAERNGRTTSESKD